MGVDRPDRTDGTRGAPGMGPPLRKMDLSKLDAPHTSRWLKHMASFSPMERSQWEGIQRIRRF